MRRLLLLPFLALSLYAANVAGSWTGAVEVTDPSNGNRVEAPVRAVFEQKGDALSVRITRRNADAEASGEGKLVGDVLTFTVKASTSDSKFDFRLRLASPDRLEGTLEGKLDDNKISGKVQLTRQSVR
jgi:autotransporter translocation and assembly factor TamB